MSPVGQDLALFRARSELGSKGELDLGLAGGRRGRITSAVVRELCLNPGEKPKQLKLSNATVDGCLDLSDRLIEHPLTFVDCTFGDGVRLLRARAEKPVEFHACEIGDVEATLLKSECDLVLRQCSTRVTLTGAEIKGDLVLTDNRLRAAGGAALNAAEMLVEGSLHLNGTEVHGAVNLASTRIRQVLDCRGGQFHNQGGLAWDAPHLDVGDDLVCEAGFAAYGALAMPSARVKALRFGGATLVNPEGVALHADSVTVATSVYLNHGFHATGTVRLVGARIGGELLCSGGVFESRARMAIEGERLDAGDVYLDCGFVARGGVGLAGAMVARQVTCTGGQFDNPGGYALDAGGLSCGRSVFLDAYPDGRGFTANGQVRLVGVSVGDELTCTGGYFNCPAGIALNADGLTTEGNVFLDGQFRAVGEVRLARATVGRQLRCTGASLDGCGGLALDLSGVVAQGDVELDDGFQADGEVRLYGARVARNVDFTNGRLTRVGNRALQANKLRVGGSLYWRLVEAPAGLVDLSFAELNTLADDGRSWPTGRDQVVIEGLTYLSLDSAISLTDRLTVWNNTRIYSLQQYKELAKAYREAGRDHDARDVLIAGFQQQRVRGSLSRPSKVWNFLLDHSVRYGYKMWRPVLPLLVLGAIMGFVFQAAFDPSDKFTHSLVVPIGHEVHNPNDTQRPPYSDYPDFHPFIYSYQLLVPIINVRQLDFWIASGKGFWGTALLYYTWGAIVLGWLVGIALLAGANHLLRHR
ncbi:hypothetical protein [Micromonospora humida]|uniref:hypothetical protein n=1 Tax=Micromonospora humida TaxID=2809018 RepID=UPI0034453C44